MNQMRVRNKEYDKIFVLMIILFVINWWANAWMTDGPRVFYLDDLDAYNLYQSYKQAEGGVIHYLFNMEAGKIRIIMNFISIIIFEIIEINYELLDTILLVLNWANCALLFFVIRKIINECKWKNEIALVGGSLFAVSRFAYYNITEFWGVMESVALFLAVVILFFLVCFVVDNENGYSWYLYSASFAYLLIIFIHERYIVLLGVFGIAILCKYRKNVKKWIRGLPVLLIFLGFWCIRFIFLGNQILLGTGGTNITDTFSIKQMLLFVFSQIGYLLGFNCGPSYLNGIDMRDVSIKINLLIIISIAVVFIILIQEVRNRETSFLKVNQVVIILSFIACCIISSSATIRVEMRWIYVSYAAFLILILVSFAHIFEHFKSKHIYLLLGSIFLFSVFGYEFYYRAHYDNIYYWSEKNESKNLYENTVKKHGDNFINSKTILISSNNDWTEEKWKKFFSPYFPSDNLEFEHIYSITELENIEVNNSIVLLYEPSYGYVDITERLQGYKFISGFYEDGWCEKSVQLMVRAHSGDKVIIECNSLKDQIIEIWINGVISESKNLCEGTNIVEINLNEGINEIYLNSNYEEKLSDPDQRVCSYYLDSVLVKSD